MSDVDRGERVDVRAAATYIAGRPVEAIPEGLGGPAVAIDDQRAQIVAHGGEDRGTPVSQRIRESRALVPTVRTNRDDNELPAGHSCPVPAALETAASSWSLKRNLQALGCDCLDRQIVTRFHRGPPALRARIFSPH